MLGGPAEMVLSATRASELGALRRRWGHCYAIWYELPLVWVARRRDDGAEVRRRTVTELLDAIRDDHATRPVPPECRGPEAP